MTAQKMARVRAKLAEWDRPRDDELLRFAVASAGLGLAEELNRPRIEREPFLSLPAFARILEASDDTDQAIARAAALIERLRHIANHRRLMKTCNPERAIASSDVPDVNPLFIQHLIDWREFYKQRGDSRAAHYQTVIEDLSGPFLTRELWAHGYDRELIGKRGGARKTAKSKRRGKPPRTVKPNEFGRWRPLLVCEIAALVPGATVNYAAISELLTAAGIETTRQYVRSTLEIRNRRRP
ncbi:MAG: hypothetical protein WDZ66_04005 [Steroidobacteraceae bacterium]